MSTMSKRREVAIEVIESYRSWDIERILAYRTDNCIQEIVPRTLNRPPKDNASYREYFASIMHAFQDFQPKILELVEDERQNKVMMWVNSTAQSLIGPYGNEYMILLYFNESGDKVERIVEFIDSAYSKEFFTKLGQHMAKMS